MKTEMTGRQLKNWRKRAGLSRSKGAAALGIALSTLGNYENGTRPVPLWIVKLIEALGDMAA